MCLVFPLLLVFLSFSRCRGVQVITGASDLCLPYNYSPAHSLFGFVCLLLDCLPVYRTLLVNVYSSESTPVLSRAIEFCTTPTIRNSTTTPRMDSADSDSVLRRSLSKQASSLCIVTREIEEQGRSSQKFLNLLLGQFEQLLDRWDSLAAPPSPAPVPCRLDSCSSGSASLTNTALPPRLRPLAFRTASAALGRASDAVNLEAASTNATIRAVSDAVNAAFGASTLEAISAALEAAFAALERFSVAPKEASGAALLDAASAAIDAASATLEAASDAAASEVVSAAPEVASVATTPKAASDAAAPEAASDAAAPEVASVATAPEAASDAAASKVVSAAPDVASVATTPKAASASPEAASDTATPEAASAAAARAVAAVATTPEADLLCFPTLFSEGFLLASVQWMAGPTGCVSAGGLMR